MLGSSWAYHSIQIGVGHKRRVRNIFPNTSQPFYFCHTLWPDDITLVFSPYVDRKSCFVHEWLVILKAHFCTAMYAAAFQWNVQLWIHSKQTTLANNKTCHSVKGLKCCIIHWHKSVDSTVEAVYITLWHGYSIFWIAVLQCFWKANLPRHGMLQSNRTLLKIKGQFVWWVKTGNQSQDSILHSSQLIQYQGFSSHLSSIPSFFSFTSWVLCASTIIFNIRDNFLSLRDLSFSKASTWSIIK